MLVLFAALIGVPAAANLPAWYFARSKDQATWWLPLLGAPAILTWGALTALGIGPQSLANLVEPMGLAALSVPLCYGQVFLLNRRFSTVQRTSFLLALALVTMAVLLRLLMPLLPTGSRLID